MDFPAIYDSVVVLTARPDLVKETILAVQKATQHLHNLDFWHKDLNQRVIAIPANDNLAGVYTYQINRTASLPRYRKLAYARKFDLQSSTSTNKAGEFFVPVQPEAILDSYHINKPNRFFIGGDSINFISNTIDNALLIGYYQHPAINPITNYTSWIADEYPMAIITEAASRVNTMIGKLDEAQIQQKEMNSPDSFNPGWIQKIFAGNLEDEAR